MRFLPHSGQTPLQSGRQRYLVSMSRMYTVSSRSSMSSQSPSSSKASGSSLSPAGTTGTAKSRCFSVLYSAPQRSHRQVSPASMLPRAVSTPAVFSTTPSALGPASYRTIEGLPRRSVESS